MADTFEDQFTLRLDVKERWLIEQHLQQFPGRWNNHNHYVRCAIIAFNRQVNDEYHQQRTHFHKKKTTVKL